VESSPKLPEWLNNVLATLPLENAVRCLTLPPDHPFRKDHIDRKPGPSEEDSVFAFQAPVDGPHPEEHTKTEGQPKADLASFRTSHGEPVGLHGCCPTASQACTAPFSTPGPWTASACWKPPSSPPSCISQPTVTGALKVLDTPLPFSMPGPFVPVRPTYDHVLDRGPTAHRDVACHAVLPVAGWSGATSFPDPRATKIDGLGSYLPSDQGNGNEFLESFSSSPKFILDDVAGPPSSLESIPPTVYFGAPIENLSFYSTSGSAPACSKDELMVTASPRSLTWGSPSAMTRPSGVADNTGHGHAKPAVFLSDIQLDLKDPYGAFPLILCSIESSLDGERDTESLPNLHRSQTAPTGVPPPVTPPPFSKHLPADFGWISPDASNPDIFERIESVYDANID
jgi:hypothetical protein